MDFPLNSRLFTNEVPSIFDVPVSPSLTFLRDAPYPLVHSPLDRCPFLHQDNPKVLFNQQPPFSPLMPSCPPTCSSDPGWFSSEKMFFWPCPLLHVGPTHLPLPRGPLLATDDGLPLPELCLRFFTLFVVLCGPKGNSLGLATATELSGS